jgi:radical SAM protein with 4Fe4S-binding SPASM domain
LKKQQVIFKITTNGTLLSEEKITNLVQNPYFKQINFSLHALKEEEINGEILEKILQFSKKLMLERNDVFVNYRLWNYSTVDEIKNNMILAKISNFFQLDAIQIPANRRSKKLLDRIYLNIDKRFEWPINLINDETNTIKEIKGFCHGASSQLGILLDGTVVPCCLDSEGEINLGNIDQVNDFQAILNSSRLQNICKNFAVGKVVELFCQKCTFRKRFL